ncbi:hypothetical protein JOC95_000599 [Bacillus tianshenii]|uniref:Plasmid segregation centromere-binding protein ParR n=1 Tax=Sutcliffiella tianshenii TaxID=1463404 RepID=A0ABS2NVX0_9BACI|nr:hypothetical protein [Bacillus tianshenii]MBM7618757.1 hypothetical protein [Bacillus tianshenii]MCA1321487.1 hypothetical protein [Bacillus tianshenii]
MKKTGSLNEIKRGQAISFRIPSDTPDHLLKHLQKLKETERRNFSSKIAEFVLQGVTTSSAREKETISIPLPNSLNKSQRDWLKHQHSEALLGSIVYQLLSDPVRATSILAAMNSNSTDIDQALYLQEDIPARFDKQEDSIQEEVAPIDVNGEDDLDSFDWDKALQEQASSEDEPEELEVEDVDKLLGDFLAHMNK